MIGILQRYEVQDKVFVMSLIDNGLDEESLNLILQLVFLLPYLKSFDLRRNCISQEGIKTIEDKLKEMEGVTGVVRTQNQVLNVHSGNQLRLTVDLSEQMPKSQVTKEVDFTVQADLCHDDADPFLTTDGGGSQHPWTKSNGFSNQRSPPMAVADPSAVDLAATTSGPQPTVAPVVGGPPVGLGGPGNLSALNKKEKQGGGKPGGGRDRVPAPANRKSTRKKSAPPAPLHGYTEYPINERVVDKWQAGGSLPMHPRPSSAQRSNSNSSMRSDSSRREDRNSTIDRSRSMPGLHSTARSTMPSSMRPPRR